MPAVPLQCPTCAGLIQIDTALAGQPVACPLCHSGMVVPPEPTLWEMLSAAGGLVPIPAAPAEDLLTLGCPVCTGPFQTVAAMAGQQVACPHCGSPVTVPAAPLTVSSAPLAGGVPPGEPPAEVASADALLPPGVLPSDVSSAGPVPPPAAQPAAVPAEKPAESPRPARRSERASDRLPPSADDLLPPGMGGKQPERRPASPPVRPPMEERSPPTRSADKPSRSPADDLLPPAASGRAPQRQRDLADLLPPGAVAQDISAYVPAPAQVAAPAESDAAVSSAPTVDDLLPPGAPPTESAPPQSPGPQSAPAQSSAAQSPRSSVDALLPPGAASAGPALLPAASQAAVVDSLLPPAIAPGAPAVAGRQVPIPKAPKRLPGQHANLPAGAIVVPTPDGDFVTVKETPKTIGEGEEEIELRRLSSQEKSVRKFRKNLLLGGFCLLIIVIVLIILLR